VLVCLVKIRHFDKEIGKVLELSFSSENLTNNFIVKLSKRFNTKKMKKKNIVEVAKK
jgi:hypothetical protein